MKNIILIILFLPVFAYGQKKVSSYPYADSVNNSTFLFGSQADQGNNQFQYSMIDMYNYLLPLIVDSVHSDTAAAINIYNRDGALTGNRRFNMVGDSLGFFKAGTFTVNTNNIGTPSTTLLSLTGSAIYLGTNTNSGTSNVPIVVAHGELLAQTVEQTITTYATTKRGTYSIGIYINITAVTSNSIEVQVSWTDENGISRNQVITPQGLTSPVLSTDNFFLMPTIDIRAATTTIITISTIMSGSGSMTYDVGAIIKQEF